MKNKKKMFATRLKVNTIEALSKHCESNGLKQCFIVEKLLEKYFTNPAILN